MKFWGLFYRGNEGHLYLYAVILIFWIECDLLRVLEGMEAVSWDLIGFEGDGDQVQSFYGYLSKVVSWLGNFRAFRTITLSSTFL